MSTRIGVDMGGTFTDLIAYDDATGAVTLAKSPSTIDAPAAAVLESVSQTVGSDVLARAEYFLHGTTVALNALLQRSGARVGLLATAGFRDVLEIRRGSREEMLNLWWRPPAPLVPRRLRMPIRERTLADGRVLEPLDGDDVAGAVGAFEADDVDAVAVAFINSYSNPDNELAAADALRRHGYRGEISLSHQVSGEYREFERTSTTVIDAYVRGVASGYLGDLQDGLRTQGCSATLLIMRSGGGSMTFDEAAARPFETIISGPVAGVEGAAAVARELEISQVIAADVGGTSFDVSVIIDGRPQALNQGEVIGFPVQAPWVDVRSIGAGGGSIAEIDSGGLLRVGPRSAGSVPGPASYGRGGTEPTVTDAALVLGMLGAGSLAGGLSLDPQRRRTWSTRFTR
jgi:N-methylhydantoinase A